VVDEHLVHEVERQLPGRDGGTDRLQGNTGPLEGLGQPNPVDVPSTNGCSPSRLGTIPRPTRPRMNFGAAPLPLDSWASVIAGSLMGGW
jgi:hypothetical protein